MEGLEEMQPNAPYQTVVSLVEHGEGIRRAVRVWVAPLLDLGVNVVRYDTASSYFERRTARRRHAPSSPVLSR